MTTLYHQVWIDATAAKVYSAIATADGLGRWWAAHTSTETAAGLVLTHNPGDEHGEVKMKVLATIQDRRNPGRWLGLDDRKRRLTVLDFRHSGWDENSEFLGFCNFAGGETLLMLKRWCESR